MKGNILIADANWKDGEVLADLFSKEGYQVELAKSGTEVIRKVQDKEINVLIMDVELQGMKGYELVSIVKKFAPDLLVIMTSRDSSIGVAKRVREEEIFYYCIKPIDIEEIKLVVKEAFAKLSKIGGDGYGFNEGN